MKNNYIYDYIDAFEKVLSVGHQYHYSTTMIERMISYSSFFWQIEKDNRGHSPIINDKTLIKEIYKDIEVDMNILPTYNQCLWAAESYLRIQGATRLSFECIFLYIPIKEMYRYFPLYHEMDFSHIINRFNELYNEESALSILLNKYKYSLKDVSSKTGISYETLYSLKKRRRDIKKISVENLVRLANIFNVRIETIAEIEII